MVEQKRQRHSSTDGDGHWFIEQGIVELLRMNGYTCICDSPIRDVLDWYETPDLPLETNKSLELLDGSIIASEGTEIILLREPQRGIYGNAFTTKLASFLVKMGVLREIEEK